MGEATAGPLGPGGCGTVEERIRAAMVEVAALHGYGAATVERILARAGVSRSTFYAHFPNRDECFLDAYGALAARLGAGLAEAAGEASPDARPRMLIDSLLSFAAREPSRARVLFVEGLAGPPAAQAQHQRLTLALEREFSEAFAAAGRPPQLPPPALFGALDGIVVPRLLTGDAESLPGLLDDLLAWVDSYRLPPSRQALELDAWDRLGQRFAPVSPDLAATEGPRLLPRGRSALPAAAVARARRERILAAVAVLSAERGYAAMTVSDIVAAAKVPRRAFYALFDGKEDAFRAAQGAALQGSVLATTAEYLADADWHDRAWRALAAFLEYVGGHPDLARLGLVEIYAVGADAVLRQHDNRMAFAHFLEDNSPRRPHVERLPRLWREAVAGAINEPMRRYVARGDAARLPELLPQCAYLVLAPLVGPGEATDLVVARARAARPAAPAARPRSAA